MNSHSAIRIDDPTMAVLQLVASELNALALQDGEVRSIYNAGVQAYQSGRYDQAEAHFHLACLLMPGQEEYVFGLSLALKMAGKYDQALPMFLLASALADSGFKPRLHAVECLLHLQRTDEAISLLQTLVHDVSSDVDSGLLARAKAWLQLAQGESQNAGSAG